MDGMQTVIYAGATIGAVELFRPGWRQVEDAHLLPAMRLLYGLCRLRPLGGKGYVRHAVLLLPHSRCGPRPRQIGTAQAGSPANVMARAKAWQWPRRIRLSSDSARPFSSKLSSRGSDPVLLPHLEPRQHDVIGEQLGALDAGGLDAGLVALAGGLGLEHEAQDLAAGPLGAPAREVLHLVAHGLEPLAPLPGIGDHLVHHARELGELRHRQRAPHAVAQGDVGGLDAQVGASWGSSPSWGCRRTRRA